MHLSRTSGGNQSILPAPLPPGPLSSIPTFTPCRSLFGSGGGTTASLVLIMGTMFIRRSSCNVLFRFRLFWSSWKSKFVTKIWTEKMAFHISVYNNKERHKLRNKTLRITVKCWSIQLTISINYTSVWTITYVILYCEKNRNCKPKGSCWGRHERIMPSKLL